MGRVSALAKELASLLASIDDNGITLGGFMCSANGLFSGSLAGKVKFYRFDRRRHGVASVALTECPGDAKRCLPSKVSTGDIFQKQYVLVFPPSLPLA